MEDGVFSGRYRSIDEWCYAYDEVDLGFTWGVTKYLHWETKWLINSMIDENSHNFNNDAVKILNYGALVK